jgi:hypothetical protein
LSATLETVRRVFVVVSGMPSLPLTLRLRSALCGLCPAVLCPFLICQLLLCPLLLAQIAVDGTLVGDESDYGAVLSVQCTNTQYGNATNGDARLATGGSEIDQVFGVVRDNRLFVLITGNLGRGTLRAYYAQLTAGAAGKKCEVGLQRNQCCPRQKVDGHVPRIFPKVGSGKCGSGRSSRRQ